MKKKPVDFDVVRQIGLAMPGVEEVRAWGSPALKANGKMFACIPVNKAAEPGSLLLRVDLERRDEMMAADPDTYYTPDHYLNYPSVLVRLKRVDEDMLRDLLGIAYRFVSNRPAKRPAKKAVDKRPH